MLQIGLTPKHFHLERGSLLIDDEPDMSLYERARLFDPKDDSFNPVKGMTPRKARQFADLVYPDKDLMTYRDGKRALVKMLNGAKRLDQLPEIKHKGYDDARETVDDLLLTLSDVFCRPLNAFSFKGSIVARINRVELGDDDARILAALLISQFKGTVLIPDFGFYARPFHSSLIRQGRLIAGVYTLSELDNSGLRDLCMTMEKVGRGCIYKDAVELAQYARLRPDPTREKNPYNEFIEEVMA